MGADKDTALFQLKALGIESFANSLPDELSGGMRQRVMIAMALACEPDILIADEPTTALDVTIQAQILELMKDLANQGMTMVVVTHEMGFAREVGTRIMFMDEGKFIEEGDPKEFFANPQSDRAKEFLAKVL